MALTTDEAKVAKEAIKSLKMDIAVGLAHQSVAIRAKKKLSLDEVTRIKAKAEDALGRELTTEDFSFRIISRIVPYGG